MRCRPFGNRAWRPDQEGAPAPYQRTGAFSCPVRRTARMPLYGGGAWGAARLAGAFCRSANLRTVRYLSIGAKWWTPHQEEFDMTLARLLHSSYLANLSRLPTTSPRRATP